MALGGGGGIRQQIVLEGVEDILRRFAQLDQAGTKAFTDIGRAADTATGGINQFARSITQGAGITGATRAFTELGRASSAALLSLGGFGTSLGIAGGIAAIAGSITKTKNEILEIRRLSQATGFEPTAIKAINETIEDLGGEAGSGNRALLRLSQAFAEVRQQARNTGEIIGNNTRVLRGSSAATDQLRTDINVLRGAQQSANEAFSGVQVARGGIINKTEVKNATDAFKVLRVDMTKFKDDEAGNTAAFQAIVDGFANLEKAGKVDLGNLAAAQLFGVKNMKELMPVFKALAAEAGGLGAKMAELRGQGRGIDPDQIAKALEYNKALRDLEDQADKLGFALLRAFGPTLSEQLRLFTDDINSLALLFTGEQGQGWDVLKWFLLGGTPPTEGDFGGGGDSWLQRVWIEPTRNALATMGALIAEFVPQIPTLFLDAWKTIWDGFTAGARLGIDTVWGWLKELGSGIAGALSGIVGGGGTPVATAPIPAKAAGGLISGPGTGTSDSILARLSNGEFVVNAMATAQNLPLLRALNDGLFPRGRRGFATGGLVTAGAGGTPVHLHIGNGEFALSGSQGVVDRLVKEAHRQHVRSAGVKPSWYGGR